MNLRERLGRWLLSEQPTITVKEYEGSTAVQVQNPDREDLHHIFYIKKYDAVCDKVIEDLEGTEYTRTDA